MERYAIIFIVDVEDREEAMDFALDVVGLPYTINENIQTMKLAVE